MALYESELTGFLRSLMQQHPELAQKQREARALWWERKTDPDDEQRQHAAEPKRAPYVYYTIGKAKSAAD